MVLPAYDPYFKSEIDKLSQQVNQTEATTGIRTNPIALRRAYEGLNTARYNREFALEQLAFGREQSLWERSQREADRAQTLEGQEMQAYTNMALLGGMGVKGAYDMGWIGSKGTVGTQATSIGGAGTGTGAGVAWGAGSTSAGLTGSSTGMVVGGGGSGGGLAVAAPGGQAAATGATASAASGITGTAVTSYIGGYMGAKQGPGRTEDIGAVGTLGMGGIKEKKVTGGAIKGAGAGAAVGATVGTFVFPIVGTAVGAVVGTIAGAIGGAASETVICTELVRQGLVDPKFLELESRMKWDFETYYGYRLWADPIVRLMKHSKLITQIVLHIAHPFLEEVAHRVDPNRKGNLFGKLIIKIGVPFCRWNFFRSANKSRYFDSLEVS